MDALKRIKQTVELHQCIVFIRGTSAQPLCEFSSKAVTLLKYCDANVEYFNIFKDPEIRAYLPEYTTCPTFPQLFIRGEFIGGCDVIDELFQKGELQKMTFELNAA